MKLIIIIKKKDELTKYQADILIRALEAQHKPERKGGNLKQEVDNILKILLKEFSWKEKIKWNF